MMGGGGGFNLIGNEGSTPLSADQLEEAKALTATKLKQFKKDRLF